MIEVKIPRVLDVDALHEFKRTWVDAFRENPRGTWLLNSHIMVVPTAKLPWGESYDTENRMFVYAYDRNKILIGEFRPDHGMIKSGVYYPIITFYNQLNYLPGHGSFNVGVPNNTRIELQPGQEELVINEETLLKCVRDSWAYLKIFDDKEETK